MVIADSTFESMLQKYMLKLYTMYFLSFVNDPFILNKSGSLCFLLFLFIIFSSRPRLFNIIFIAFKTGIVILF